MGRWDGIELVTDENEEEYTVTEKPPWGMMFANQVERINRTIMYGRGNAQAFRDNVDLLYNMMHGDKDKKWEDDIKLLDEWRDAQLRGLPPRKKAHKHTKLSWVYTMKKYRLLLDLAHRRGYAGKKIM